MVGDRLGLFVVGDRVGIDVGNGDVFGCFVESGFVEVLGVWLKSSDWHQLQLFGQPSLTNLPLFRTSHHHSSLLRMLVPSQSHDSKTVVPFKLFTSISKLGSSSQHFPQLIGQCVCTS